MLHAVPEAVKSLSKVLVKPGISLKTTVRAGSSKRFPGGSKLFSKSFWGSQQGPWTIDGRSFLLQAHCVPSQYLGTHKISTGIYEVHFPSAFRRCWLFCFLGGWYRCQLSQGFSGSEWKSRTGRFPSSSLTL